MSKLPTTPYKGARDFYPEDKRLQKYVFGVMRSVCESYGYEEYDAPMLEPTDLYLQKGSEEIIKDQTYTFEDRGGRSVTMRTEMTPTVSRMVASKRQELGYPLRWFSIPQCWRYERMQRGRGREFYQLNVDIFGEESIAAEHELLLLASDLMKGYGATQDMYEIRLGSRAFLNHLFGDVLQLSDGKLKEATSLLDKSEKMEPAEFRAKLVELLGDQAKADLVENILTVGDITELDERLQQHESLRPVTELLEACRATGVGNVRYDASITRGFDYYTDIVFEVFDTHPDNNRSMFGGGRYDSLIGEFGVEPVPTVGFGMGDLPLQNFLELHDLLPVLAAETDVYVATLGDTYQAALEVVTQLREQNINVALDSLGRKPEKAIKAAQKKAVEYVLFIGQNELDSGEFSLKNISTGKETKGDIEAISQQLLSR